MNWGKGIVIGMSLFIVFILVLVIGLMSHRVDLQSEDYYQKEESENLQYFEIARKVSNIAAFWFYNQASTKEDFDGLLSDKSETEESEEKTEEVPAEESETKPASKRKTKKS